MEVPYPNPKFSTTTQQKNLDWSKFTNKEFYFIVAPDLETESCSMYLFMTNNQVKYKFIRE